MAKPFAAIPLKGGPQTNFGIAGERVVAIYTGNLRPGIIGLGCVTQYFSGMASLIYQTFPWLPPIRGAFPLLLSKPVSPFTPLTGAIIQRIQLSLNSGYQVQTTFSDVYYLLRFPDRPSMASVDGVCFVNTPCEKDIGIGASNVVGLYNSSSISRGCTPVVLSVSDFSKYGYAVEMSISAQSPSMAAWFHIGFILIS